MLITAALKRFVFIVIFVTILASSVVLSSYRIAEPLWESGHHGFHLSEYPHNALNYLRYGYLDTKFGLVVNYGDQRPDGNYMYRVDHPMLTPVIISIGYRLFGVHDWSARLSTLPLAIGTSVLIFLLALSLFHNRWYALMAFFFAALMPVQIYYARLLAPHILGTFFSVLAFLLYWKWFVNGCRVYLIGMWIAFVLGVYTEWVVYFAFAPILAHYLLFHSGRRDRWLIIALLVSPFLLFGSYLIWTYSLVKSLDSLWLVFTARSQSAESLSLDTWRLFGNRAIYWLSIPVALLSLGWLAGFLASLFRRRVTPEQALIFALLLFALSHNLLFVNLAIVHDFVMIYHFLPFASLAAASVIIWFVEHSNTQPSPLLGIAIGVLAVIFVGDSVRRYVQAHEEKTDYVQAYYLGHALDTEISSAGRYIDVADLFNHNGTHAIRAYAVADRPYARADSLAEVERFIQKNPAYEAVVVENSSEMDSELIDYLIQTHPRRDVAGFSIFDLTNDESNVLGAPPPSLAKQEPIEFQNGFEFLGAEVQTVIQRRTPPDHWLAKYLNRYPELLYENQTTLKGATYWRKTRQDGADYALITALAPQAQSSSRLEPLYPGLDRLFPSSRWPVGQVIRNEFEIVIPSHAASTNYDLLVGVGAGGNGKEIVTSEGCAFVPGGLISVAAIDVQGATSKVMTDTTEDDSIQAMDVVLANDILFLGYEQEQANVEPGDDLELTFTWCASEPITESYKIFVHIRDAAGQVIAQGDTIPGQWQYPTNEWAPGWPIRDQHTIELPEDIPPGNYSIGIGLYTEENLERVPVTAGSAPVQEEMIILGEVDVRAD